MDLKLVGKVALVTGGSSGIGLETVRLLLDEGAVVVACARGQERLQAMTRSFADAGFGPTRLIVQQADVLNDHALASLADVVRQHLGRLDLLVCNAGQARLSTFATTGDRDWEDELRLKIFSVVRPIRRFQPLLMESGAGAIVVVNSLLARQPEPHMVCTSAARAAVQNLVKSLSVELAPSVRVNAILLGTVNSGQWARRYAARDADDQRSMEQWLADLARDKGIPLGRFGRPEEPAAAIAFLLSPRSSFTTGASLEISGGISRFA